MIVHFHDNETTEDWVRKYERTYLRIVNDDDTVDPAPVRVVGIDDDTVFLKQAVLLPNGGYEYRDRGARRRNAKFDAALPAPGAFHPKGSRVAYNFSYISNRQWRRAYSRGIAQYKAVCGEYLNSVGATYNEFDSATSVYNAFNKSFVDKEEAFQRLYDYDFLSAAISLNVIYSLSTVSNTIALMYKGHVVGTVLAPDVVSVPTQLVELAQELYDSDIRIAGVNDAT